MKPQTAKPDPDELWTIQRMIRWATDYFAAKDVPSPRLSIEWLLADLLRMKRLELYTRFDRPLSLSELDTLRSWVKRRAAHEPLQYITGSTDFYHARIHVNPSVLIPRPETEELVTLILDSVTDAGPKQVLDIGTGSGCIAIALKMERPNWDVTAIDISEVAIATARANAELNKADIHFMKADFLTGDGMPEGPFDLIVSNPPYIRKGEAAEMDKQVLDHEPHLALFCENVSVVYTKLTDFSAQNLQPKGTLWMELNESYDPLGHGILPAGTQGEVLRDSGGKNRFLRMWITC